MDSIKAYVNSYITLETAAIFFQANLYLKQGSSITISSENVVVDFICMGLLELWGAWAENFKMKNSCPQWDSNLIPSVYEANLLSIGLLDLISVKHLIVDRILPESAI